VRRCWDELDVDELASGHIACIGVAMGCRASAELAHHRSQYRAPKVGSLCLADMAPDPSEVLRLCQRASARGVVAAVIFVPGVYGKVMDCLETRATIR
jgi:pimeloyl-ACP methyl ester carboxylesterase